MQITDAVTALSRAIAHAEGFFVYDSLPQRANNPGDLELGDQGCGLINKKTIFETPEQGWAQLEHQCTLILGNLSAYYHLDMTLLQFATVYTGADHAASWAQAVAENLRVPVTTTLRQFRDGQPPTT